MIRAFVFERIATMGVRPMMWARTKESFGMQLVLLAEIALYEDPGQRTDASGLGPTVELMRRLFSPGNTIPNEPCDDAWALKSATITKAFLDERLTP